MTKSAGRRSSYPVIWQRQHGRVYSGRLELEEGLIRLAGRAPSNGRTMRMGVPTEQVSSASVTRDRSARLRGLPTLTLELHGWAPVLIAVVSGPGRLQELAAALSARALEPEVA